MSIQSESRIKFKNGEWFVNENAPKFLEVSSNFLNNNIFIKGKRVLNNWIGYILKF